MRASAEIPFRICFGVLWILYFGIRIYFQGKVTGKRVIIRTHEKQESLFFRLFALAYLLLPLYFLTPWIDFAHFPLPAWLRWLGGVVACAGVALFSWAHYVLGMNWTAILALSKEHELVTQGPYRYVRHPMYSAFFTIGLGFLFLSANGLVGFLYLSSLILMYAMRVSREEEMMISRFGETYREYMQKTGRILPRFKI
ncbi:MAG TPA: protein-S-isoprenylcysteine O-methyltransferase [Anaerolineales bacterium]|nr:protein-S-isoprenylcysteine O-methyltransferase [Anaerolineales bacterium]